MRGASVIMNTAGPDSRLVDLLASAPQVWHERLCRDGALRFRGFADGLTEEGLTALALNALGQTPCAYIGGASRRHQVGDLVYTSTDTQAAYPIRPHIESAYLRDVPRWIAFHCIVPATTGGITPVVDMVELCRRLPAGLVDRFTARGVRYRNRLPLGFGFGKSWPDQFGTSDRGDVERILASGGWRFSWEADGTLVTEIDLPATLPHPISGARCWINQADHWHHTGLDEPTRNRFRSRFQPHELVFQALHGDGGEIDIADLGVIRATIDTLTVRDHWQAGDLLLCDNWQMAHGRDPYTGPRRVVVSIA